MTRRKQFKKAKLRWRVSKDSRKSLTWIPFKSSVISYTKGQVHLNGKALSLWDSFGLADFDLGSGSIAQDVRARWYINIVVRQCAWPLSDAKRTDPVWVNSSEKVGGTFKGQEDLEVRNWTCTGCGVSHDRNTNGAINIRDRGLRLIEQDLQARRKAACQSAPVAMEERSGEVVANKDSGVYCSMAGVGHGTLDAGILFQLA